MSRGSRIYIGKIAYDTRPRDLEDEFARFGRIRDFHFKGNYAFITYDDRRDAEDAIYDMDDRRFDGSRLIVQYAKERRDRNDDRRGGGGRNIRSEWRVTVDDLPTGTSWQDLKDLMREAGEPKFANTFDNGTRGVVEFMSEADMKEAIHRFDGKDHQGRQLKVAREGGEPSRASPSPRRSRSRSRSPVAQAERKRSRSRSKSRSRSPSPNKKVREDEEQETAAATTTTTTVTQVNADDNDNDNNQEEEEEKAE